MTILSTKVFNGEVPRIPADKLPDGKAQSAINCNFAYGELRPMAAPFLLTTLSNLAKSVFSLNGLTFYSWPYRTKAWKGPVIGDAYDRMYYTSQNGGMRVARTVSMVSEGGEPPVSYKAGVPSVEAAPSYTLLDRTSLPDYPNAIIKLFTYFEKDGKKYEESEITYTTVRPFTEFTFTISDPTTLATGELSEALRSVRLSSLSINQTVDNGDYSYQVSKATPLDGQIATIQDSSTVVVGATTYTGVVTITPTDGPETTPGAYLNYRAAQIGGSTPITATPAARVELVDAATGTTVFSLSAASGAESSRSDAVPGGVEATMSKAGTGSGTWKLTLKYGVMEARAYVVTMVNQWGEESKPSPPVVVQPTYMQTVAVQFTAPSFADYVPCNKFRLYRSTPGGSYLSVTESPQTFTSNPSTYVDASITVKSTDAVLETIGWDLPPANLQGLTLMPNGFFAGFFGDTMYFSEPYRPWAWPYSMTFPVNLVGMRSLENSLVVTTVSYPYLVNGVHPDAMTQSKLSESQAGVSDHGMCVVGNTVAYISNDGLAIINGFNVDLNTSQQLWTREAWRDRYGSLLSSLELAYHDGSLVCGTSTAGKMWEIRLDPEGGGNLTQLGTTFTSDALYVLPASDQLYMVQGRNLMQYKGAGTTPLYEWWSKDYILPKPSSFTVGYIDCSGPVTVTLYADGVQRFQGAYIGRTYFRIPSGSKALRWSYKLNGSGRVKEISFAERRQELRGV